MQGVRKDSADDQGSASPDQPSPAEIRAQLERIVASSDFAVSERVRNFLRYIVEETLAGRANRLKAYSIALAVFDRDQSFDTQHDPLVRVEAGRLRRALERYYLLAGQADPIEIIIPKGAYRPDFVWREQGGSDREPEEALVVELRPTTAMPARGTRKPKFLVLLTVLAAALIGLVALLVSHLIQEAPLAIEKTHPPGPTLAVLPFRDLGEGPEASPYAMGLTEEILSQLALFKELAVLGRETSRSIPGDAEASRIHRELGVRYVLEGSVRLAGGRIRVTTRLLNSDTATVLWSQTYDDEIGSRQLVEIQEKVARQVATAVAQPYGVIFRADARRTPQRPPDNLEAYLCTLRFYDYRAEYSPEQHALVRGCLERAVALFPGYATAWAMLSTVYLDEDRFQFNPRTDSSESQKRALEAARRAVRLEPDNIRALQSLMTALFFTQNVTEALAVGERALAINPNDTELLGEFGSRIAQAGHWKRGMAMVEQALAHNPGNSGYYYGILALAAYMERDYDRAVNEIQRANLVKFPIYHLVAAIIYAQSGMTSEAAQAGSEFLKMRPDFFNHLDLELAKRNFRLEDQAHLISGLLKAGLLAPAMVREANGQQ